MNYSSNSEKEVPQVTIYARNIDTDKIICSGTNGESVIAIAQSSGEDYILEFETELGYNFLF